MPLIALLVYFPLQYLSGNSLRATVLAQAQESVKQGDVDLALRHIDRYLGTHPDDVPALEAKAKILTEAALPPDGLLIAANTLDQLIRIDPQTGPGQDGRAETRRKLAEYYIRYSDELKRSFNDADPNMERRESRYAAAASIASQLIDASEQAKKPDAVAYRLLARASEGQVSEFRGKASLAAVKKDDKASTEKVERDLRTRAITSYKKAIAIDPQDLDSTARLASLYMNWVKDQASADALLDAMLAANPKSVPARMIRYRVLLFTKREALAEEELKSILAMAPDDHEIRIEAAYQALGRGQSGHQEARRQLDAIPNDRKDDLRIRILRGALEHAAQHPDEGIEQWRKGLQLVGGSHQDLTWRLAFSLIQLGRFDEAEPLRKQYMRLAKGDKSGLGKYLDALVDLGTGRYNDARVKLEKIKDIVPTLTIKADVLLSLGRCYEAIGDTNNALYSFRNAASAAPQATGPRLAIARLIQKRNPEEAVLEVDRALSEAPTDLNLILEAIRLRIVRKLAQGDQRTSPQIEQLIARAEAIAKDNPLLLLNKADYYATSARMDAALELLKKATEGVDRNRPEAWIATAIVLTRMNRLSEALIRLDEAAKPENVGDRVRLRIAKAQLLSQGGRGQAAKETLSTRLDNMSPGDRAELSQALGELLRQLGDRDGARAAFAEWARLAPSSPNPGLALLSMAQIEKDDRAGKLGLEALRAIGGDLQPYGKAAKALELIRTDSDQSAPPLPERLLEAEQLVSEIRKEAPSLRIASLIEGMILEFRGDLAGAVKAFKQAQNHELISPALPRLIQAYLKLKRFDELRSLEREFDTEAATRQQPALSLEFDRVAAAMALKLGEKDQADYFAARMAEGQPDSVKNRIDYARLLDSNNKPDQAEESLRSLVKEKPNDPTAWLTLIAFQNLRRTPADIARTIGQFRREYKGDLPELRLAQCYWIGRDLTNARTAYQKAVEVMPEDQLTLRSLVEFYEDTAQSDLVEPVLWKVLKINPRATWAGRALALRLSARPDPENWAKAWSLVAPEAPTSGETPEDRLIRATVLARSLDSQRRAEAVASFVGLAKDLPVSSPLAVDTRLRLAQAMIDVNRFAEAWDAIEPIADDTSRPNLDALALGIESLARSGRPEEAERRLDRLTTLATKSPQISLLRAWVLMSRGKKLEAHAAIEAAYKEASITPNAEAFGLVAVNLLLQFDDTVISLKVAETLAQRWPKDAWVLARVQVVRKEYDAALASCQIALEAGSAREALQFAMAAAIARRGDSVLLKKVTTLAEAARVKAPDDFNVMVFLATLRHIEDRYDEEVAYYTQALGLKPTSVQFLNNMAWTLCEGMHNPKEALVKIEEAIRREGEAPQFLDTRGVILSRLGNHDAAIADLEKSIQLETQARVEPSSTTYFHLARAYLHANRPADSRRYRDLALKAGFDPESLDPTDKSELSDVMGKP